MDKHIKNNKMLAHIFRDIDYVKKAMYLYAFMKNRCDNNYADPIKLFSQYNIISCSSFNMVRKHLDYLMLELNEMITDLRRQLDDGSKELFRQNGINSKTLTWDIIDRLDWGVYCPDSNLPREYHEVAVPIVLRHLIDCIFDLLACEKGEYTVTNNALGIKISVKSENIADELATVIPNITVRHGERFLYKTNNADTKRFDCKLSKFTLVDKIKTDTSATVDVKTFDIILIEKPGETGLTKDEIIKLCNYVQTEVYPIEIEAKTAECSAMGFITNEAADCLDFDYVASGLSDFIALILDNMNNESETETYEFRGLKIKLTRNI